jgi:hypothetical protein
MQPVDEVDQFAMLVVDGFDANTVMSFPLNQSHVFLRSG